MKKILKITIILIMTISMLGQLDYTYATKEAQPDVPEPTITSEDPNYWKPSQKKNATDNAMFEKAGIIVGVIRGIGIIVSVVALMIIGIKSMALSAEEKSIYKEALPRYILGAILVFAMTTIPSIIYTWAKGVNKL